MPRTGIHICRTKRASPTTPGATPTSTCVLANTIPTLTTSSRWDRTDRKEPMMTLRTGNRRTRSNEPDRARAFTLIELILVMALLLIVIGVALPSLKRFFHGRNLDSEARRFLSLTRYGQSRAVSEGVPMVLWIDVRQRTYGLQAQSGYLPNDTKAIEYDLDKELRVEVQTPVVAM